MRPRAVPQQAAQASKDDGDGIERVDGLSRASPNWALRS